MTNGNTYLSKLTDLDFSGSTNLTTINNLDRRTKITSLKLANTKISSLTIPTSPITDLTTLDVSGCTQLPEITNLTNCTGLTSLNLSGTEFTSLTLPAATGLTGTLDLSNCTALNGTVDLSAATNLTGVDLTGATGMTVMPAIPSDYDTVRLANTGITTVDLSNHTSLADLTLPSAMISLDLSGCTSLEGVLDLSSYTSLTSIDLANCSGITSVILPPSAISVTLEGCTGLTSITMENNRGVASLDLSSCSALETIDLSGSTAIASLTLPTATSNLKTLDLEGCTSLTSCTGLTGTELDLTAYTSLETVKVAGTGMGLTRLDLPASVITHTKPDSCTVSQVNPNKCGDGLVYSFDTATGQLTIYKDSVPGTGAMFDSFTWTGLGKTAVTSVVFEVGVTAIGANAFSGFTNLEQVNASQCAKDLISIGAGAFNDCGKYTSANFANCTALETVANDAFGTLTEADFSGCESLASIDLSENTALNSVDFSGCGDLETVTLPDSVTTMNFQNCESLASFTVPTGVITIAENTFNGCSSLETIDIHDAIVSIGTDAFNGCSSLSTVNYDGYEEEWTALAAAAASGNTALTGAADIHYLKHEETCNVNAGNTSISLDAILNSYLTEGVTISSAVLTDDRDGKIKLDSSNTITYDGAFSGNGEVTVTLSNGKIVHVFVTNNVETHEWTNGSAGHGTWSIDGNGVLVISGTGALPDYGNSNGAPWYSAQKRFNKVVLTDGITKIGGRNFQGMTGITEADFSACSTLETIGNNAFADCTGLTSVNMAGSSIKNIGDYAFEKCNALTTVALPDETLETIGMGTFQQCTSLADINLSECRNLTEIGGSNTPTTDAQNQGAFYNCTSLSGKIDLSNITSLTKIGGSAFRGCIGITELDLSGCENLTWVGGWVTANCPDLQSVDLSNTTVSSIGNYAFENCPSLTEASLPDTLTVIPEGLFNRDKNLETLHFNNWKNVSSIGYRAFLNCSSLEGELDFSGSSVLSNIGAEAFKACSSLTSLNLSGCTLPDGALLNLGDHAFANCGFTSIDISNSSIIEEFKEYTFEKNSNLVTFNAEGCSSLTKIGTGCFKECSKLETVDLDDCRSLVTIGAEAFISCSVLRSVSMDDCTRLVTIGDKAFNGCKALTAFSLDGCSSLTSIGASAFDQCVLLENIDFADCTSLSSIGNNAFYNCDSFQTIDLSNTALVTLGSQVFRDCDKLTSVNLSGLVLTSIDTSAFNSCDKLETVLLPASITSIGESAFQDCKVLDIDLSNLVNLENIGKQAFYHNSTTNTTPYANYNGSVSGLSALKKLKTIGDNAFGGTILSDEVIDFSNGALVSIGVDAFSTNGYNAVRNTDALREVILAGCKKLTSIGNNAFYDRRLITAIDLSGCGTETENGFTIGTTGFKDNPNLETVDLSGSKVTEIKANAFLNDSKLSIVQLDGCDSLTAIGANAFSGCVSLSEIDMSSCVSLTTIGSEAFTTKKTVNGTDTYTGAKINTISIPQGVTSIAANAFAACNDVTVLNWNAENYTSPISPSTFPFVQAGNVTSATQTNTNRFDLTVGSAVRSLPENFFHYLNNAGDVYFDGGASGHEITINLSTTDAQRGIQPICNMGQGAHSCFVDSHGVLYELDKTNNKAALIYCPPELDSYKIPDQVDGCAVTEIGDSAFTKARGLTTVTFEKAANITKIGDSAFMGLKTLTSVAGADNVVVVKSVLVNANPQIDIAGDAFSFTGLKDNAKPFAPGAAEHLFTETHHEDGNKMEYAFAASNTKVTLVSNAPANETDYWQKNPKTGESTNDNTYHFLTGQQLSISVEAQSSVTESGKSAYARVYFEFSDPDFEAVGSELKPTSEANIKYVDFILESGETENATLQLRYPSPASAGGDVKMWVEIFDTPMTAEQINEASSLAPGEIIKDGDTVISAPIQDAGHGHLEADWITYRRERDVRKTYNGVGIQILGNAESANANLYALSESTWDINMAYADEGRDNTNDGADYVKSAHFEDQLDLPQGIVWDPDILAALAASSGSAQDDEDNSTGASGKITIKTEKMSETRTRKNVYVNGVKFMYIDFPTGDTVKDISLEKVGEDNIQFSWTMKEMSGAKELSNLPVKMGLFEGALKMDLSKTKCVTRGGENFASNESSARQATEDDFPLVFEHIKNQVDVDLGYTHSAQKSLSDEAESSARATRANLTLEKVRDSSENTKLGDDLRFTITVRNTGTQATHGIEYLEDVFESSVTGGYVSYFTPQNMADMIAAKEQAFAGQANAPRLELTITDASLYTWTSESAAGHSVSNSEVELNRLNSGIRTKEGTQHTIVISETGSGFTVKLDERPAETRESAAEVSAWLDSIGYYVTAGDHYSMKWKFADNFNTDSTANGKYRLPGGGEFKLPVYATNKNTFQLLPTDTLEHYQNDPLALSNAFNNRANLRYWEKPLGGDNYEAHSPNLTELARYFVSSEVDLRKNESVIGTVSEAAVGRENSYASTRYVKSFVMSYTASASNTGTKDLGVRPMLDQMTGSQALLAPVSLNAGNTVLSGLDTVTVNGEQYYVLTAPNDSTATYTNVYLGQIDVNGIKTNCLAAQVQVTGSFTPATEVGANGNVIAYNTNITWYLDNLRAGNTQKLEYKSVGLAVTDAGSGLRNYSYNNKVFLNNLTSPDGGYNDRLFDTRGGASASYGVKKSIVGQYSKDQIPSVNWSDHSGEVIDEDDYTRLTARENTVMYKIALTYDPPSPDWSVTFKGDEIKDMLPKTYGVFEWKKEGGIGDEGHVDVHVVTSGGVTKSEGFDTGWSISSASADSNQVLSWPGTASVKLTGKSELDIYVVLTYADSAKSTTVNGQSVDDWTKYCKAAKGVEIVNMADVCNRKSSVKHDLIYQSEAYLQKGVNRIYDLAETASRTEYSNSDYSFVEYYAVVYNGGYSKLYLGDLVDILPRGFTFHSVDNRSGAYVSNGGRTNTNITTLNNSQMASAGTGKPATILDGPEEAVYKSAKIKATEANGRVTFAITGDKNSASSISFDSVVAAETRNENTAWYLNHGEAITFTYTLKIDTLDANTDKDAVNQIFMLFSDPVGAGVSKYEFPESSQVTGVNTGVPANDGDTVSYDGGRGLLSSVVIHKGRLVPGITKHVTGYVNTSAWKTISDGDVIPYADQISWQVNLLNEGTRSISGYTVTDTMQLPFQPFGRVDYSVYDQRNVERISVYTDTSSKAAFLIDITHVDSQRVTFLDVRGQEYTVAYGTEQEITLPFVRQLNADGTIEFRADQKMKVLFTKANTTASVKLVLDKGVMDIMSEGHGTLTLSTKLTNNISTTNREFVNTGDFKPQEAFTTGGTGLTVFQEGTRSVRNSSKVTITQSGGTSARKLVEEISHADNKANSTPAANENRVITLHDANNQFTYTLEVSNKTNFTMGRLVITDNLPQVNDHYTMQTEDKRGSQFDVDLVDGSVTVKVIENNGTETTLSAENDYTVQFSKKTEFDENDLKGNGESWNASDADARSIQVNINHDIPDKAVVQVSFQAKVAGERGDNNQLTNLPEQGTQSNNSFAYWYQTKTSEIGGFAMSAATDIVGVKTPAYPALRKQVVNRIGQAVEENQESFYFVIYQGGYNTNVPTTLENVITVSGDSWTEKDSDESGKSILKKILGSTKYQIVKVVANAEKALGLYQHEFWTQGETYTIQELTSGGKYQHVNWNWNASGGTKNRDGCYSFVYDGTVEQTITARNVALEWNLIIEKVSSSNQNVKLAGAEFALYSKIRPKNSNNGTDLTDAAIEALATAAGAPAMNTDVNGVTWYFIDKKTTGNDGKISWNGLLEEQYRFLEVKAPAGYNLPTDGYMTVGPVSEGTVITSVTVTVPNTPGVELPATGGPGNFLYTTAGMSLALLAAWLLLLRRRREQNN